MSIAHLPATASADEIHSILDRDAALIIDDLADADLIDRDPYRDGAVHRRHTTGQRRLLGPQHSSHRRPHRPVTVESPTDPASDDPRRHRSPAAPSAELPAAPHAGDLDRSRLSRSVDPSRPVGVRLLRLPERLRRAVQHHLGAHRFHGSQRRHPGDAGQPASARQLRAHRRRDRAGRDDQGFVPALHGQGVPRRWRQHVRADSTRVEHHLQRRLVASGGEPVPVGTARRGRDAARRAAPADGVPHGRLRPRLHRRCPRPDRSAPRRHRLDELRHRDTSSSDNTCHA